MSLSLETATLGGGCFWCLEAVFQQMQGVQSAVSGYAGGSTDDPTYQQVCTGQTGHAEVVQVTFDPQQLSFSDLLDVFFTIHDPTTRNRQGADVGTQYRSVIFVHSAEQEQQARQKIAAFESARVFPGPIVTEVTAAPRFYAAEDYHQGYFQQNSGAPYCQLVVAPKIAKFRSKFGARIKDAL